MVLLNWKMPLLEQNNRRRCVKMFARLLHEMKFDQIFNQYTIQEIITLSSAPEISDESILPYACMDYLSAKVTNRDDLFLLHHHMAFIMSFHLNYLPDAYEIAFRHFCFAASLKPNDLMIRREILLIYQFLPDYTMNVEEGERIAKEMLDIDPNCVEALHYLEQIC